MRYKIFILFIIFALFANSSIAQSESGTKDVSFKYRGFSGGMMIHTGYLRSKHFSLYNTDGTTLETVSIKGMPFGIGGALRFDFGTEKNRLRVGSEGYTSSIKYYSTNSYEKIGWGGILIDYQYNGNKYVFPFVGATLGGGNVKNHTYLENTDEDFIIEDSSSFRNYSFFCITPFVGMEIAVSKKMRLILKGDFLINVSNRQNDFAQGARIYVGMVFNHSQSNN